jgi:hypothetical protein
MVWLRLLTIAPITFKEIFEFLALEFTSIPKSRVQIYWPSFVVNRCPRNQSIDPPTS